MEKVIINNQVVTMRKHVKQAKIRAINNYTKEIRKLQNWKGSEDAATKHKRKAERLLAKVTILKKINPDVVSRKAMEKEKDWKSILKQKNIPLEDQCYAMLANYTPVQNEVEKFHKKYWDLVPQISAMFKEWEEKSEDPISKQEKKKAKQIRKNMKQLKMGKNNPNAIPIGIKKNDESINKDNSPVKNMSNNFERESSFLKPDSTHTQNVLDKDNFKRQFSPSLNDNIKQKNYNSSEKKCTQRKTELHKTNTKSPDNIFKCNENVDTEDAVKPSYDSDKSPDFSEEEINMNEDNMDEDEQDSEEINIDKVEDFDERKLNVDANKLNNRYFREKQMKMCENEDSDDERIIDSDGVSENSESDFEEGNFFIKSTNTKQEAEDKIKLDVDSYNILNSEESFIMKSEKETVQEKAHSNKDPNSQDIQSRLLSLAETIRNTTKTKQQKLKPNSNKQLHVNKLKAVAMVNLNELLEMDEIPIEQPANIDETSNQNKRKKDPFFLGKGGEIFSENEDEETTNNSFPKDQSATKKNRLNDFDRRDSFPKKSFQASSKHSFRDQGPQRSFRDSNKFFEDNKNSSGNRKQRRRLESRGRGFQSKSFSEKSPKQFRSNECTESREKDFQKNSASNINIKTSDEKPLHPSWEAKKKLKKAANLSKFQGKRIVFDD